MVVAGETVCPHCGGGLKHYDRVRRIIRTKGRVTIWVVIGRSKCAICGSVHRVLPRSMLPYRQYESEVIFGVLEGLITSDTLGYEDYPCETTMIRWLAQIHRGCFYER